MLTLNHARNRRIYNLPNKQIIWARKLRIVQRFFNSEDFYSIVKKILWQDKHWTRRQSIRTTFSRKEKKIFFKILTFQFFGFLCTFSRVHYTLEVAVEQTVVVQNLVDVHVIELVGVCIRFCLGLHSHHYSGDDTTANNGRELGHFCLILFNKETTWLGRRCGICEWMITLWTRRSIIL